MWHFSAKAFQGAMREIPGRLWCWSWSGGRRGDSREDTSWPGNLLSWTHNKNPLTTCSLCHSLRNSSSLKVNQALEQYLLDVFLFKPCNIRKRATCLYIMGLCCRDASIYNSSKYTEKCRINAWQSKLIKLGVAKKGIRDRF